MMFITRKKIKQDRKNDEKYYSISFSANTVDFKLLNSLAPYYKVKKVIYKGKNTDTLFIRIGGQGKDLLRVFNRYNKILKNLTYQEKNLLKYIKNNSYISKKYNFCDDITLDDEKELFKIYLPNEQVDYYNDYYNFNNQDIFYTKRINYEKTEKNIQTIDITLQHCIDMLDDFKLSDLSVDLSNGIPFMEIFHKRIKACEYRLKRNYLRVQDRYKDYDDFIKSIVCYGTTQTKNNRYWQIIKRELY